MFRTNGRDVNGQGKSLDSPGPYGPPGERGASIVAGQVAMATGCSGQRTMPTCAAGSPIDCRDCKRRQGRSRGRSACCTERCRGTVEWKEEEKMWKNNGRICENHEEIAKKMKAKFLIERIC